MKTEKPSPLGFLKSFINFFIYLVNVIFGLPWWILSFSKMAEERRRRMEKRVVHLDPSDPFSPYRCVDAINGLFTKPEANVNTMADIPLFAKNNYGKRNGFGTRVLLNMEEELQKNGKVFKKYIMGDYEWITYDEFYRLCSLFSDGVIVMGLKPKSSVVIICETRVEWLIAAMGCFMNNITVVTLYVSLGEEAIAHAINESGVEAIVTSETVVPKFKNVLLNVTKIKYIIDVSGKALSELRSITEKGDIQCRTLKEIYDLGSKIGADSPKSPPSRNDIAVIMYTSGSTGVPKGVLISHNNLICAVAGFEPRFISRLNTEKDTLISYLPLSHIYELLVETFALVRGLKIGYSSPHTITNRSTGIKPGHLGDMGVLKPNLMCTVPMILDRMYQTIFDRVARFNWFKRNIFFALVYYKKQCMKNNFRTPLLDKYVFKRGNEIIFGGNMKLMMCAGAPLSPDVNEFLECALCVQIFQAYGLTETTASASIPDEYNISYGKVGHLLSSVELRLKNWEEAGYLNTDKPNPRGEILLGGGVISPGYLNKDNPESANFISIDGVPYFCTGDIAELYSDGTLKIIDRKKDLIKLQGGEYVSLAKVENAILKWPLIENCCVIADNASNTVSVLISPNMELLTNFADKHGYEYSEITELCSRPEFVSTLLSVLQKDYLRRCLERFETPTKCTIVCDRWLPEDDLVTASFKIKRTNIMKKYRDVITKMLGS